MKQHDIPSIRRAIASLAGTKYLRRYPAPLRARLVSLVRAQPKTSVASLARALDMAPQTLARMVAETRRMVPVQVIAEPATSSALVVRGPHGVVVEGLDIDGVAKLIRALS